MYLARYRKSSSILLKGYIDRLALDFYEVIVDSGFALVLSLGVNN